MFPVVQRGQFGFAASPHALFVQILLLTASSALSVGMLLQSLPVKTDCYLKELYSERQLR